jgi:hypothetical protein
MEIYRQFGAGEEGGRQSYADALAQTKYWQVRTTVVDTANPEPD